MMMPTRFWDRIMKWIFPEANPETDSLSFWRTRILSTMLFFGIAFGFLVLLSILPMAIEKRLWGLVFLDALIWSAAVCLLLLPQIPYTVRAVFALLFTYIIGLAI